MEEARSASRPQPNISYKGGSGHVTPAGSNGKDAGVVKIDPNMRVVPNPGFVAWRERLFRDHGV